MAVGLAIAFTLNAADEPKKKSSYPPPFKDARVETYRKIGATELKLWIFGESDPKAKKSAIVFFFGGGWQGGYTGPVRESGPAFRNARHNRTDAFLFGHV